LAVKSQRALYRSRSLPAIGNISVEVIYITDM
jgi:hypothetical protein